MKTKFTEEDMQLFRVCNTAAGWGYWRHAKLFYALKDAILQKHGTKEGYDLQTWDEKDWYSEREEVHAEHRHILERWALLGQTFHKPTNEFEYFNFEWQTGKYSENFYALVKVCLNTLKGRKLHKSDLTYTEFSRLRRQVAWPALKFLIKRFGHLLNDRKTQSTSAGSGDADHSEVANVSPK